MLPMLNKKIGDKFQQYMLGSYKANKRGILFHKYCLFDFDWVFFAYQ